MIEIVENCWKLVRIVLKSINWGTSCAGSATLEIECELVLSDKMMADIIGGDGHNWWGQIRSLRTDLHCKLLRSLFLIFGVTRRVGGLHVHSSKMVRVWQYLSKIVLYRCL